MSDEDPKQNAAVFAENEYRTALAKVFQLFADAVVERADAVHQAYAQGFIDGHNAGHSNGWNGGWRAAAKVIAEGLTPEVRAILGPDLEAFVNAPDMATAPGGEAPTDTDTHAAVFKALEEQLRKGKVQPS